MFYYLIGLIFTTFLLGIDITKAFLKNENNENLLFLTLCNALFLIVTTYFFFFLNDAFLALLSSFFLLGYAIFIVIECKKKNHTIPILDFPYLIFTIILFFYFLFFIFF